MVIENSHNVGVLHPFGRLHVLAVVHQKDGAAGSIFKDRRHLRAGFFQDIGALMVHRHCDSRFCRISQRCQQPCVCDGAADRIRIRALMTDHINRLLLNDHVLNAGSVKLLQPFQCYLLFTLQFSLLFSRRFSQQISRLFTLQFFLLFYLQLSLRCPLPGRLTGVKTCCPGADGEKNGDHKCEHFFIHCLFLLLIPSFIVLFTIIQLFVTTGT